MQLERLLKFCVAMILCDTRQSTGGLLETTFRIAPALVDVGPLSFFTRAYEVSLR